MPIIRSAIKKLRQDKKRTAINRNREVGLKEAMKKAKTKPTLENVKRAQSLVSKAVKTRLLHKNKAARLSSRLAKYLPKKAVAKPVKKRS